MNFHIISISKLSRSSCTKKSSFIYFLMKRSIHQLKRKLCLLVRLFYHKLEKQSDRTNVSATLFIRDRRTGREAQFVQNHFQAVFKQGIETNQMASLSGGCASLLFDQGVPQNLRLQCHLPIGTLSDDIQNCSDYSWL